MTNGVVQVCPAAAASPGSAASDVPPATPPLAPPFVATAPGVWASPELAAAATPPARRAPAVVPTGWRVTDEHAPARRSVAHNNAPRRRRAGVITAKPVRS